MSSVTPSFIAAEQAVVNKPRSREFTLQLSDDDTADQPAPETPGEVFLSGVVPQEIDEILIYELRKGNFVQKVLFSRKPELRDNKIFFATMKEIRIVISLSEGTQSTFFDNLPTSLQEITGWKECRKSGKDSLKQSPRHA